jgi:hypothetical protein
MLMTAHDTGLHLDDLSDWQLPPSSASDMRPVRVFDSAEAALRFLRAQYTARIAANCVRPIEERALELIAVEAI